MPGKLEWRHSTDLGDAAARGLAVAEGLATNVRLADRVDVFEIEQFVALNVYSLGEFAADGRKTEVVDIVHRYNEIVEEFETDPSLQIELP